MQLRQMIRVSRPRFWLYELGTFAVGAVAAFAAQGDAASWWQYAAWFLYFTLPANFLIYGVNDVFDYETDRRNPKKQGYESLLPREQHRAVLLLAAALTVPFLFLLPHAPAGALLPFALFLFCAVFYSAPPVRAKAVPLLDALFSAGHYVATGWFAYALSGASVESAVPLLAGLLWCVAMHAYSAVPDIRADRESGLSTVATLLGPRGTVLACAALYAASAVLAWSYLGMLTGVLLVPYLALMASSYRVAGDEAAVMVQYRFFPYLNAAAGAAIWWFLAWPLL